MNIVAPLTTLAGLVLYWMDSGFRIQWIVARPGLGVTAGGPAGIAAFVPGVEVMRPTTEQMTALGKEMQLWGAILLVVAVTAMSVARYL